MRKRWKWLSVVSVLVAMAAGGVYAMALPAAAAGGPVILLQFTNQSGRGDPVYLYVLGTDLSTGRLGYVDATGIFTNWPVGANPPAPAPDVSIGGPSSGGSTTLQVPRGVSGRIYFSLGVKLKFFLTPEGLVQPAPWAVGDPNQSILFDWSEFTYNDSGLWLNSSQVDMFAIPHTVTVTGSSGTHSTGAVVSNGRDNVIDGIKSAGWGAAVDTRSDGTVLRVLSPGKAADAGRLSATYLDSYISDAWNAYTNNTLSVAPFRDLPDTRYFGHTSGTLMNFTNGSGQPVASFQKPSSADVWGCAGNLSAPNDLVVGPIARTLCAALNRGTLATIDSQPSSDASQFYRNNPNNQYARLIHANMTDGKAYAFAFDDVGNFESLVSDRAPTSAGITLNAFTGGATTPSPSSDNRLISNYNNKCLDVPGFNFTDGQHLDVWDCNNSSNQNWEFIGGTVRTQNNLCADAAGAGTTNGTPIQIATCSGNPAQQFTLTSAGDLVNPQANRCVDITDWSSANGAALQLWDCVGSANQKWHRG